MSERYLSHAGERGRIYYREDLTLAEVEAEIDRLARRSDGVRALKEDTKTSVYTGLQLGETATCAKVYRKARRGRRSFKNHCALRELCVPVPEPLFFWKRSRSLGGGAVLGMSDLSALLEFDRWLAIKIDEGDTAGVRLAARSLARVLRDLHERKVYLDDMKTCNIFIEESEKPRFHFIDLDGARLGRSPSLRQRVKCLAQLDRSTPLRVGLETRRVFWEEYCHGLSRRKARQIRNRVIKLSAERPILYVTPEGVRTEPWPARARYWPR